MGYGGEIVLKPSLIPYLGRPVGLMALAGALYALSQPSILALPLATLTSTPTTLPEAAGDILRVLGYGSLLAAIIAGFMFPVAVVKRNANTYTLTSESIIIDRSLIRRVTREIPYSRISDCDVAQTFLGRVFNYGDVIPISISGFGLISQERFGSQRSLEELDSVPRPHRVKATIMRRLQEAQREEHIEEPAPPPPQPPPCSTCGIPMSFIERYQRWYCWNCKKYGGPLPAQELG